MYSCACTVPLIEPDTPLYSTTPWYPDPDARIKFPAVVIVPEVGLTIPFTYRTFPKVTFLLLSKYRTEFETPLDVVEKNMKGEKNKWEL